MREEIETYFTMLGRKGLPKDLAGRDIVRRPFEVPARFIGILFAFFAGFTRATGTNSDIPCEMNFCKCQRSFPLFLVDDLLTPLSMLTDFMYYRVGIFYTMWLTWVLRELFHLCSGMLHLCASHERKDSLTLRVGLEKIAAVVGRFFETVGAALFMNLVVFTTTTVLQFGDSFAYAWVNYAEGFITDIWGTCAASGYKDAWGYDCISY